MIIIKVRIEVTFVGKEGVVIRMGQWKSFRVGDKILFINLSDGLKCVHLIFTQ